MKAHMPAVHIVQPNRHAVRALKECEGLFQKEIDDRLAHIDELRRTREWVRMGLNCIDRKDRYILDLAYIGPQEATQRLVWRGKGWKEISTIVGCCESSARHRAYKAMDRIKSMKGEKQNGEINRTQG